MNTVHFAIIEDETFAMCHLQKMVERLRPDWRLSFTAKGVEQSVEMLQAYTDVDLIFMDIQLGDGECFEIFRRIECNKPIIFTTAYDEYAIRAFKVKSIDYLLKPVDEQELEDAIVKFEEMTGSDTPAEVPDYSAAAKEMYRGRILLRSGDNYAYINSEDIAYVLSEENCVFIYPHRGPRRLTEFANLQEVMERLDSHNFFQPSRNIIASINAVEGVSKYFRGRLKVRLAANGETLETLVPAARKDEFLNWLGR